MEASKLVLTSSRSLAISPLPLAMSLAFEFKIVAAFWTSFFAAEIL